VPALTTSYRIGHRPTARSAHDDEGTVSQPPSLGDAAVSVRRASAPAGMAPTSGPAAQRAQSEDTPQESARVRGVSVRERGTAGPAGSISTSGCWPSPGRQACRPSRPGASWTPASTGTAPTAGAGWTAADRPQLAAQIDPARREPTRRAVRSGRRLPRPSDHGPGSRWVSGSVCRPSRRGVGGVPGPHPREPRGAREA